MPGAGDDGSSRRQEEIQLVRRLYAERLGELHETYSSIIVIDLSDGTGDARLLAEAIADAAPADYPVAYWNP